MQTCFLYGRRRDKLKHCKYIIKIPAVSETGVQSSVRSGFPASRVPVYLKGAGEIKQAIRTASGSWIDLRGTKHSHGSKLTHQGPNATRLQ